MGSWNIYECDLWIQHVTVIFISWIHNVSCKQLNQIITKICSQNDWMNDLLVLIMMILIFAFTRKNSSCVSQARPSRPIQSISYLVMISSQSNWKRQKDPLKNSANVLFSRSKASMMASLTHLTITRKLWVVITFCRSLCSGSSYSWQARPYRRSGNPGLPIKKKFNLWNCFFLQFLPGPLFGPLYQWRQKLVSDFADWYFWKSENRRSYWFLLNCLRILV